MKTYNLIINVSKPLESELRESSDIPIPGPWVKREDAESEISRYKAIAERLAGALEYVCRHGYFTGYEPKIAKEALSEYKFMINPGNPETEGADMTQV